MPAAKPATQQKKSKRNRPKKADNPLFVARPKNLSIGGDLQPKRDLTRVLKWPKYVRLQRQKRILMTRLKVPPALNQFTQTLEKGSALTLFKLADKYKPETPEARKQRQLEAAKEKKEKGQAKPAPRPKAIKAGIKEVTSAVEKKTAKLVVIAHDVSPIELVVWLPALCRKQGVPFVIVKGKSRLGQVVGRKTCSTFAFTEVNSQDTQALNKLAESATSIFNNNNEIKRVWGGLKLGKKTQAVLKKRERLAQKQEGAKIQ